MATRQSTRTAAHPSGLPFTRTRAEERARATRNAVIASQRGRIIEGAAEAASEKGYTATTVGDIVARARVSRTTFYEHFATKDECLVAVVDLAALALTAQIADAARVASPNDPGAAVDAMIDAFCTTILAQSEFARVFFCEALAAGELARAARDAGIERVIAQIRQLLAQLQPDGRTPVAIGDTQLQILIDGIAEHTRRLLDHGRLADLPGHAPDFAAACRRMLGLPARPGKAPRRR